MLRARLAAPRTLEIEEVPTPTPGEGEVLLRVSYVAICGSEFAAYRGLATGFPIYEHQLSYPRHLGHEASGVVEAVGPGVTTVRPGQCVVPRRAHYATHAICRADALVSIPPGVSQKQAALALMTQETYYVCRELAGVRPADRVLIVGLGPFGMLCLEHVREIGCLAIAATDLVPDRLALARRLGATHTWNADAGDLAQAVADLLGQPPTLVIDTTGQPGPLRQVFKVVAPEGRVVLAGRPYAHLERFDIEDLFHRMVTVYGAKTPPAGYDARYTALALDLIRQGKVHADLHITHEFPLRRIDEAFQVATRRERGALKVVVNCAQP